MVQGLVARGCQIDAKDKVRMDGTAGVLVRMCRGMANDGGFGAGSRLFQEAWAKFRLVTNHSPKWARARTLACRARACA